MSKEQAQQYIASDGTVLTDELIDRLADEAENGFANSTLEAVGGRPWEAPREPMKSHAIRMPDSLWTLVEREARLRHMSVSEYTRQSLIRNITPQTA